MPTQFSSLDAGFPTFTGQESTEQKVDELHNFTYMLVEYLRYILRNLGPENLNTQELTDWLESGEGPALLSPEGLEEELEEKLPELLPEILRADAIVTNELYADYGAVADLTVDELRTDYQRAARYLAGNTGDLDYIHIHDEEINFITGTVKLSGGVPLTEQLHHGDRYFYWTDAGKTEMTSVTVTAWPVTVYQYDEAKKGRFYFTEEEDGQGNTYKVPVLKLGQGSDAGGVNSTGRLIKHTNGLELSYTTEQGAVLGIWQRVEGYMDLYGLRKPTALDFSAWDTGLFSETLDGGAVNSWVITFEDDDPTKPPIKFTDGSGHETAVIWEAEA